MRIIDLSSRVVSTDDLDEFNRIASELRAALREHAQNLRREVEEAKKRLMGHHDAGKRDETRY
jgi:BMFP domain-containing protein YqiC